MVCERNKAHCSPIRRRFLKIIVAALLLNTAEAQTERAPWLERTKTSDLIARRDARAQQKHGPAAIFASSNAASKLRSPIASFSPMKGKIATLTAIEASETRKTCAKSATHLDTPTGTPTGYTRYTRYTRWIHGVQTPTNCSGGGVCGRACRAHSRRGLPSFARNEHRQQANNMSSPPYGL